MAEAIKTRRGESQGTPSTLLYNLGEENIGVTGGWEAAGYYYYKYPAYYSIVAPVKNVDSVSLVVSSSQYQDSAMTTINKIDVTDYTTLKVEYTSSDLPESFNLILFGVKSTSATIIADVSANIVTGANVTLSCDVSSVTGEYYVSACGRTGGASNAGTVTVHKVWLE